MSDCTGTYGLTTGEGFVPDGWSYPAGKDGGMVWIGKEPATMSDYEALKQGLGDNVQVDMRSIVGLYNIRWTSAWNQQNPNAIPMGGEGSVAYELKLVGEVGNGVQFTKDPIWYYDSDGNLVKGIPPECGAYHQKYVGDGYYDNFEGPEPGSIAAKMHRGGEYYWDDVRKLYDVKF